MIKRLSVPLLSTLIALTAVSFGCKPGNSGSDAAKSPAVALPRARYADLDPNITRESSALITIPRDGEYFFGRHTIAQGEIGPAVDDRLKDLPSEDHIAYIRGGKDVQYGTVMALLDSIRQAGYERVGLVADREGRPGSAMFEALIPANAPAVTDSSSVPSHLIVPIAPGSLSVGVFSLVVEVKSGTGPDQIVSLNRQEMEMAHLARKLRDVLYMRNDKAVAIAAPKDKSYGDVVSIIDVVKGAGAQPIVLAIDGAEPPPATNVGATAVREGVPRGVVGGVPGGVSGGVVGGGPSEEPPPPPPRPVVVRLSGSALTGNAVSRVEPVYPPLAKAARVSGQVVVEVTVDEKGNVISARTLSGHPLLTGAAIQAARQWRFKPTLVSGVPVKVAGTITFAFRQ